MRSEELSIVDETVGPGLGPEETWHSELGYRRRDRPAEIGKTLERQEACLRTGHRFWVGGGGPARPSVLRVLGRLLLLAETPEAHF